MISFGLWMCVDACTFLFLGVISITAQCCNDFCSWYA